MKKSSEPSELNKINNANISSFAGKEAGSVLSDTSLVPSENANGSSHLRLSRPDQRLREWLPHIAVLLWILFLGVTLWNHAHRAQLPPVYDAFTYFAKAFNVWSGLHARPMVNPLNAVPSIRPPGTVLMSYPFGFSPDFRPFFFRSVFIPILCFVLALYLAAFDRVKSSSYQWNLAIMAIFLSALPLFYHFELSDLLPSPEYWGLVDPFLAGIAALAAGASVRSLRARSFGWWVIAVAFAAFSLLIKPAGAVVIGALDLAWGCALVIECYKASSASRRKLAMLLVTGTLAAVVIEAAVAFTCFRSQYLSRENLDYGQKALNSYKTFFSVAITPKLLEGLITPSFGYILPATAILVLVLGICNLSRIARLGKMGLASWSSLLVASGIALLIGLWFLIFETQIDVVRYFLPFATASIIYAAPLGLISLDGAGRYPTNLVRMMWIVPCLNLALLLVQGAPALKWQEWSGVNLISGGERAEVAQAKDLLNRAREQGKDAVAYGTDIDTPFATFSSIAAYAALLEPEKHRFSIRLPVTADGPVHRIQDMVDSDFLVFRPISDATILKAVLKMATAHDYYEERTLLNAWLSQISSSDGVTEVSETSVRVLEVTNKANLRASLDKLVGQHSWPEIFVDVNLKR